MRWRKFRSCIVYFSFVSGDLFLRVRPDRDKVIPLIKILAHGRFKARMIFWVSCWRAGRSFNSARSY